MKERQFHSDTKFLISGRGQGAFLSALFLSVQGKDVVLYRGERSGALCDELWTGIFPFSWVSHLGETLLGEKVDFQELVSGENWLLSLDEGEARRYIFAAGDSEWNLARNALVDGPSDLKSVLDAISKFSTYEYEKTCQEIFRAREARSAHPFWKWLPPRSLLRDFQKAFQRSVGESRRGFQIPGVLQSLMGRVYDGMPSPHAIELAWRIFLAKGLHAPDDRKIAAFAERWSSRRKTGRLRVISGDAAVRAAIVDTEQLVLFGEPDFLFARALFPDFAAAAGASAESYRYSARVRKERVAALGNSVSFMEPGSGERCELFVRNAGDYCEIDLRLDTRAEAKGLEALTLDQMRSRIGEFLREKLPVVRPGDWEDEELDKGARLPARKYREWAKKNSVALTYLESPRRSDWSWIYFAANWAQRYLREEARRAARA